jgi:hypothetical protein
MEIFLLIVISAMLEVTLLFHSAVDILVFIRVIKITSIELEHGSDFFRLYSVILKSTIFSTKHRTLYLQSFNSYSNYPGNLSYLHSYANRE